ncbi:hypothetical protein GCM10023333_41390 [Ferrimonas pelagia]|uniref:Uncharacterized protein n=1 Tax=Ferrimonas pelagia TaxID=1177826 RepID=A0ABP9FGZ6_9GAMM
MAALVFIMADKQAAPPDWQQITRYVRPSLRAEDLVAQISPHVLGALTACFDHQGSAPRTQLQAITTKLHQQLSLAAQQMGQHLPLQLKVRVITQWDHNIEELLDPAGATPWQLSIEPQKS